MNVLLSLAPEPVREQPHLMATDRPDEAPDLGPPPADGRAQPEPRSADHDQRSRAETYADLRAADQRAADPGRPTAADVARPATEAARPTADGPRPVDPTRPTADGPRPAVPPSRPFIRMRARLALTPGLSDS